MVFLAAFFLALQTLLALASDVDQGIKTQTERKLRWGMKQMMDYTPPVSSSYYDNFNLDGNPDGGGWSSGKRMGMGKGYGKGNGGKKGSHGKKGKGKGNFYNMHGKKSGGFAEDAWPFETHWWDEELFKYVGEGCELFLEMEEFIIPEPSSARGEVEEIGSGYNGQAVNETTSNGECTRIGTNVGQCTFTFIDTVDGFSITATGVISGDTDGGKLAITGGTGRYSGIIGSLELTPIFSEDAASEDIFLDVLGYQTKAEFGTLICRPTAPHIE